MAKFDNGVSNGIKADFQTGDQPTQANFHDWIDAIQEGIEDHDHSGAGDPGGGSGLADLGPLDSLEMSDGAWHGLGVALERFVFNAAGNIAVLGADFGVGAAPAAGVTFQTYAAGVATCRIISDLDMYFELHADKNNDDASNDVVLRLLENNTAKVAMGWDGSLDIFSINMGVSTLGASPALMINTGNHVGIGVTGPQGRLHVKTVDASAIPTLVLEQLDISEGTINFLASNRGIITGATNSVQSVRVEMNGTVYRLAVYADA